MAGCIVSCPATGEKTVTDIEGHFTLIAAKGSRIIATYIGCKDGEYIVKGDDGQATILLEDDTHQLQEVVAIGYGTTTVKSSTGSISQVKADALANNIGTNFASGLSGQVTGVQVIQPSGQPGANEQIRVRGIGTLTAGSDPLVVVDGMPLTEGSTLNSINTSSIESIEVLKDAASTAIYGSRGANGVIIVRTKQGREGKPKVSLNANYGWQQRYDRVKVVDAYQFATYLKEARNTGYVNKDPENRSETDDNATRIAKGASKRQLLPDYLAPYLNGESGLTNTNWLDEIFRTAGVSNYNVNINGGTEKVKYAFTGGYMKQDGIIIGTDFEKFSANVSLEVNPSKYIKIGTSLFPSYTKQRLTHTNAAWSGSLVGAACISYPFFSPYNEDGSYAISQQIAANTATDASLEENPVASANMMTNQKKSGRLFGNVFTEITPIRGLKYKLNLGADLESTTQESFKPGDIGQYRSAAPYPANADDYKANRVNYLVENTLNYSAYLDAAALHHLDAIIGQSYQREDYKATDIYATGFTDNSIKNIAGGSSYKVTPAQASWSMISYFGRVNYALLDRYLVNVSVRRDGSSRFGSNTKWGFFPAFSAAWVLSSESFMKDVKAVNYAKLRLSWGKSGNNQIGNYGALAVLKRGEYVFDGQLASGSIISTSPNPDLSWEKTSTWNVGLNVVLADYLGIDLDLYTATTNDLLLEVPVPEQSGYSSSLQNIGKLRNQGVELKLYTAKSVGAGALKWNGAFTLSSNKDKVLALAPGQTQIISGSNITRVGHRIGELYGYEVIGIYKTQEDLDKYPHMKGTQIGDWIIKDLDNDKEITTADKKSWGSPSPKVILGMSNRFTYKAFSLSFDLYSELGKKKYAYSRTLLDCGEGFGICSEDYFKNRWHPVDNPNGTWATPNMGNYSNTRKQSLQSNLYYDNASFLQLRSLRLGYNLPQTLLGKVGISAAEVYFLGNNLLMLTPYKGFNLEAESSSSVLQQGIEKYGYPMARTFSFGINLSF